MVTPLSILHCRLYTGHVRCEVKKVQFLVIKDWKENFPLLGQETPAKTLGPSSVNHSKALAQWTTLSIAKSTQI